MNDAAPWVDPELIAAGKLLQEKGLVAPDRTKASLAEVRAATDRIGAFLGEGSVPLQQERDLSLPGPHGQVPMPALPAGRCGAPAADGLCPWRRLRAGQHRELGPFPARAGTPERGRRAVGRLQALARSTSFPVAFDEMVAMTHAGGARGRRLWHRPRPARTRRRFRRRQSGARRGAGDARCRRGGAALSAA